MAQAKVTTDHDAFKQASERLKSSPLFSVIFPCPASLDQFLVSADHVAHRPQLRAARSAAYRRVDYADASLRTLGSDFTNGGRPYRTVDCDYAARSRTRPGADGRPRRENRQG